MKDQSKINLEKHQVYNPSDHQEIKVANLSLMTISIPKKYDTIKKEETPWNIASTSPWIIYLGNKTNQMNYQEFIFYIFNSTYSTGHININNGSLSKKLKVIKI